MRMRRKRTQSLADTKSLVYKKIRSLSPKLSVNVAMARSKVDLVTQRRGREKYILDKVPTKGKEQELNAAEAAGPYVKQRAKESQPGILMESKWGQKCVLDLLGSN